MTRVQVFDPAMCCSTGVCGPSVDPALARFAADLDWLKSQGVSVERFNLGQQPGAFVKDDAVKTALETKGEAGLPVVKADGQLMTTGISPTHDGLAQWVGLLVSGPTTNAGESAAKRAPVPNAGGCCGPSTKGASSTKSSGCC
jgi:hypothetical protein